MAMAGLGSPAEIWRWPYHYFRAVKHEYLKILGVMTDEPAPKKDVEQIAPGITVEHYTY